MSRCGVMVVPWLLCAQFVDELYILIAYIYIYNSLIFVSSQICVLRLIQVVRSVEKIEKILHQNTKDTTSLETSRCVEYSEIAVRSSSNTLQVK